MGQKKLAVLTGDSINEGFFFTRKCMAVLPGGQESCPNNEVAVRRGFTVFTTVSFHLLSSYYFFFAWLAASLARSNSIRGDEKIAYDVYLLEIF